MFFHGKIFFSICWRKHLYICISSHCISLTLIWNVLSITHTHTHTHLSFPLTADRNTESILLLAVFLLWIMPSLYCEKILLLFSKCIPTTLQTSVVCFVVFQPREWGASGEDVLVCGPATRVWNHPPGKKVKLQSQMEKRTNMHPHLSLSRHFNHLIKVKSQSSHFHVWCPLYLLPRQPLLAF